MGDDDGKLTRRQFSALGVVLALRRLVSSPAVGDGDQGSLRGEGPGSQDLPLGVKAELEGVVLEFVDRADRHAVLDRRVHRPGWAPGTFRLVKPAAHLPAPR